MPPTLDATVGRPAAIASMTTLGNASMWEGHAKMSPLWRISTGTIQAVEQRLFVDGFLLRYDTATSEDGLHTSDQAGGTAIRS